jgi:hypothetical protein
MLTTRLVFLFLVATIWVTNGWPLLSFVSSGAYPEIWVAATFILNMIVAPVAIFGAYKSGEAAEQMYRRKEEEKRFAASAAGSASGRTAR